MKRHLPYDEATEQVIFRQDSIPGYVILNEIGKGATGAVYAARSKKTGKLVAIKVLFPFYAKNREYLKRVIREAELARRLNHPNVVKGIEFGHSGEIFYFVMEYVPGKTLAQILKEQRSLPEKEAARIILEVAKALDAAHQLKIIHRDIKPSNITITPENEVKLMDFGLAKEELDTTLTVQGTILGTPCYISPEQARGEINLTCRSDIYSLGITFYHMVVGEPPFCEFNTALMLTRKTTDPIPSPRIKNPELSPEVSYIIEKMCQRDEEARYQSPAELIKDLEAYLAGTLKVPADERKTITEKNKKLKDKKQLKTIASKIPIAEIRQLLNEEKLPGEINLYNSGDVIFYEGEPSQEAYILLEGRLEVLKAGRKVAVISEPGTFVGEMATILNSPRTATVRALSEAVLLKLPATEFKTFLCQVPALAYQLAVNLAERLQETTARLKELQSRLAAIRNYFQFISEELDQS